jgi:four helix bundle protein
MHFTELRIFQIALQLAKEIKGVIFSLPHYWNIPEAKQILESSSSVHSTIAEGFAKRIYQKEFIRFLNMALGSSDECQNHLMALCLKGYLGEDCCRPYERRYKDLSIRIFNMIKSVAKKHGIELS